MKTVIVLNFGESKDESLINSLSSKVKTIVIDNLQGLVKVTQNIPYSLIVVLTKRTMSLGTLSAKTSNELNCPIIFLSISSMESMLILHSVVDSIGVLDSEDIKNSMLKDSLKYISQHLYDNELTLDKVSSKFYVSKSHYSRMFHKKMGIGFKEFVIKKRIQKAKMLLQEEYSVTDVCFMVGYNDLTHFARMFKKAVGMNPSAYRSKIEKGYMTFKMDD